jgi:hypothetical protein
MDYIEVKTIHAYELEYALKLQYGVDIKLATTMWDNIIMLPEEELYRPLWYNADVVAENEENMQDFPNCEEYQHRALVYAYLQDTIPENQCILVDVSW